MPDDDEIMSIEQAAKYLGVPRFRLSIMIAKGEIAYQSNPLDKRQKMLSKRDLDKLKQFPPAKKLVEHEEGREDKQ